LTITERDNGIAKPAEPVNGQDERRIRAAADSPAPPCWPGTTARQPGVLPPALLSERGGISMTEDEAYKVHIQYTFNAFCKVVIRHAAIDIILKLRRRWEREVSLDYLMNEKFVQFAEPEQLEEYLFTACGQTAVLYHAELAAALALLPERAQEEIFRYYFLRQPQRVIGVHIGRTRSTAGRHIQLTLKRLRRLMEGKRYE